MENLKHMKNNTKKRAKILKMKRIHCKRNKNNEMSKKLTSKEDTQMANRYLNENANKTGKEISPHTC